MFKISRKDINDYHYYNVKEGSITKGKTKERTPQDFTRFTLTYNKGKAYVEHLTMVVFANIEISKDDQVAFFGGSFGLTKYGGHTNLSFVCEPQDISIQSVKINKVLNRERARAVLHCQLNKEDEEDDSEYEDYSTGDNDGVINNLPF